MQPTPITYRFNSGVAGNVTIAFDQISKSGAAVKVTLDGNIIMSKSWKAGPADLKLDERVTIPVSAGEHILQLENTGADWAHIKQVIIPGVAPALTGRGLVDGRWGLFSLQGSPDVTVDVVLGLPDAIYKAVFWDLEKNGKLEKRLTVSNGKIVDFVLPFPRAVLFTVA